MRRVHIFAALISALALVLVSSDAAAWGEKTRQTAAAMAMQVIKGPHPGTFRPGDVNYEQDVLRGATDGAAVLETTVPLGTDAQTVQAVGNEIQLLRDAKEYGRGPYFAYRMGVLAALVADVMMPYGFAWTPEDRALRDQIVADTESRIEGYGYTMSQRNREFIRSPQGYFATHRSFYKDDKRIIANDYRGGKGYQGFLRDGGPAYFSRAVDAISDSWHTILRYEGDSTTLSASRRALSWYFVDQIAYLLQEKRDFRASRLAYENFERVNLNLPDAYERLGDLYYAFGSEESITTAVREWRIAYDLGGPERQRIAEKLSHHFMKIGKDYLARAESVASEPNDLEQALQQFEEMMAVDRTSDEAATLIQEAHVKIQERNERYELDLDLIGGAEQVEEEAERAKIAGDYLNSITSLELANTTLNAVSDEFKDLFKTAQDKIGVNKRNISDTVAEVLDRASTAIDTGSNMREDNHYAEAIAEFEKVNGILAAIPEPSSDSSGRGPVSDTQLDEKQDLLDLALRNIDEAKKAKIRYEQAQEANQAGGGPGGPRPGGGAPAPGN